MFKNYLCILVLIFKSCIKSQSWLYRNRIINNYIMKFKLDSFNNSIIGDKHEIVFFLSTNNIFSIIVLFCEEFDLVVSIKVRHFNANQL
jgi:hypothetical protein